MKINLIELLATIFRKWSERIVKITIWYMRWQLALFLSLGRLYGGYVSSA